MKNLILGTNPQIDDSAVVGYLTGRKIEIKPTVIGDNARIRSNTVIYTNVLIGNNLETGHNVVIREENKIGNDFSIWNSSTIDYRCEIGDKVRIHCNVYVAQFTVIEDEVFLAPGVKIANDLHPICTRCMKGPIIKRGARVGVNVTLLPNITIGEYTVIGAGSVVTKDIPPKTLAYGNPARPIKSVDELKCLSGNSDKPYINGVDVRTRSRS
ncbi:N-acetyltransferase [Candidatus Poribacteria bacterium]|nr:N-acetyltransferase [Candidatus Poribacteria bacterium]